MFRMINATLGLGGGGVSEGIPTFVRLVKRSERHTHAAKCGFPVPQCSTGYPNGIVGHAVAEALI